MAAAILKALDFDFFELLDEVTIARSRKHIETFYDTKDIGKFPKRRKPLSYQCPITYRPDVLGLNDIFSHLSALKLAVYAPISYILPSRLRKYEEIYDTQVEGGRGKLRQADRERSLQALMTTNLLKRLESSVEAFRLTLRARPEYFPDARCDLDLRTDWRLGECHRSSRRSWLRRRRRGSDRTRRVHGGQEDQDQPYGHGPAVVEA